MVVNKGLKLPQYITHPNEGLLELKIYQDSLLWTMGYISEDGYYLVFLQRYRFLDAHKELMAFLVENNYVIKENSSKNLLAHLILLIVILTLLI